MKVWIRAENGQKPIQIDDLLTIRETGIRYGVPWQLILALAYHESGMNPLATNTNPATPSTPETTDYGMLQINSHYHPTLNMSLWWHAWYNTAFACDLLLREFYKHQDWHTAAWMWSARDLAWATYQYWLNLEACDE